MKILHVVPSVEHLASGPSYSVPRLARALANFGNGEVQLISLSTEPSTVVDGNLTRSTFLKDLSGVPLLTNLSVSSAARRAISDAAASCDVIHSHSLWLMPNVYPAWSARQHGKPLLISPRGTLSPVALAISPLKKKAFWAAFQGGAMRQVNCFHVTSQQEYLDCRKFGLRQPIAVIPNGIDFPNTADRQREGNSLRRLLYLGRIHPIKGLENLLHAWSALHSRFSNWELRLVGPDEASETTKLQKLAAELELPRIQFVKALYGQEKDNEFAAADLFVLPSFSENFGVSVAEALAQGVPVVTTTGTPWSAVVEEECGWWVQPDVEALTKSLAEAMRQDAKRLYEMGARGRAFMLREYSWEPIAQKMTEVYRWLIEGGALPETVRLD